MTLKYLASIHYAVRGLTAKFRVKSRRREIGCYNDRVALQFDRHLGSVAVEMPAKFKSDWKSLNPNLMGSRLHEILRRQSA